MDGFLILDKPAGITSAQLLNRVKHSLPRGTKIGHAGTLDSLATGVIVALVGKATKQCERVMGQPKQYEATIRLGATSATDDVEGPITPWLREGEAPAEPSSSVRQEPHPPTRDAVAAALERFIGEVDQVPPNFSALKVRGKRASDRVRGGEVIELKPRRIRIDRIELVGYAWPDVRIIVDCGRGAYIRSLARDVGQMLDTGGYLASLRRTRVGPFTIARAARPEQIAAQGVVGFLLPIEFAEGPSRA